MQPMKDGSWKQRQFAHSESLVAMHIYGDEMSHVNLNGKLNWKNLGNIVIKGNLKDVILGMSGLDEVHSILTRSSDI